MTSCTVPRISFSFVFSFASMDQWVRVTASPEAPTWIFIHSWTCWLRLDSYMWARVHSDDIRWLGPLAVWYGHASCTGITAHTIVL